MKKPVPEEEYYTLFGYPLTKEELNHAGRELLALGWDTASLNKVTACWPPLKRSQKEVRSLQKEARIHERLLRNDLSPQERRDHDGAVATFESFRRRVALVMGKLVKGKLKPGSVELAKLTALDLKEHRWLIWVAAWKKDEVFFKTLGKCLVGEIKPLAVDDIDLAIVDIWSQSISSEDMVRELQRRGKKIRDCERDYSLLRMRKKRILDELPPGAQHLFPKRKRARKRKKA